jgi:hypothetical protein
VPYQEEIYVAVSHVLARCKHVQVFFLIKKSLIQY